MLKNKIRRKLIPSLRSKIIILSIFVTLLWTVPAFVSLEQGYYRLLNSIYIQSLIIGIVYYIGMWLILGFRTKLSKHFLIILPSSLSVSIISMFLYLIAPQLSARLIYRSISLIILGGYGVFVYISALMTNILYKSVDITIPLAKAARTTMYIGSLITIFVSSLVALSLDIPWYIALLGMVFIEFYYVFVNMWFTELRDNESLRLAVLSSIIFIFIAFVLMNWPISQPFIALALSVYTYMFLGVIFNSLNGTINRGLWLEFTLIFFVVLLVILRYSDWGINQIPVIQ